MRNDVRNTIILSALLLVILLIKISIGFSYSKKIKIENENLLKSKTELASLANVEIDTMQVYRVKLKIAEMNNWQTQNGKYFFKEDNSKITWAYLSNIINTYCPNLEINFEATNDSDTDSGKKEYSISGTTDPSTLCIFMNNLENQPMLYVITETSFSENIQQSENGERNTLINFELLISSNIDANGKTTDEVTLRRTRGFNANNFFAAKLYLPITNQAEENAINVSNVSLVSLTPNKAFVKDNNNRVYILNVGSRVAYGYLDRINWDDQSITFKLNTIGIYKELTIKLNKE